MKKLLTLFLLVSTVAASAATVYDVYETPYTNAYNEGTAGAYFKIQLKADAKLWLTDLFNNTSSAYQSELLTSPTYGLTEYGYKDSTGVHSWSFTDDSRISQGDYYKYNLYKEAQGGEADRVYRNQYYLGDFKSGDEIEIYLSNGTDEVASNTPAGYHLSTFNQRTDALNSYMDIGQLFLPGGAQINFGLVGVADPVIVDTQAVGSPLPSGTATLFILMYLAVLLYWIKTRNSNKPCDEEYYV